MSTGITIRHARRCAKTGDSEARCNCAPTYAAWVWDKRAGRKRKKTFERRSEAVTWRQDASVSVRRGTISTATTPTLREAADAWLEQCERGEVLSRHRKPYKPSALRGYKADLARYVYPPLGARRLSEVTGDDLQALVDRLVGAGLSGSKARNVLVPVQSLYRRHRRQVPANPTADLDLPEAGKRRERVAEPLEAGRLLAALPEADRALWATAFFAGLRLGELRALRVSDVDLGDVPAISVSHGWDAKEGEIEPKSKAGVRQIPVPETLREILTEHLERTGRSGNDFLFGRIASAPFTDSHMRKRARTAWEKAELTSIGFHECRHSYSSFLDAAGISETRADRYMGHSNPSVANRYRHQLPGQLTEDAQRLEEYLRGAVTGKIRPLTGPQTGPHELQTRSVAQRG